MDIKSFDGNYRWLSNFYECSVEINGKEFNSAEHAYQAHKTNDPRWFDDIKNAATPGKAKRLGAKCPVMGDWDSIKVEVMKKCVRAKFSQNADLKEKLLATDGYLEEGNNWGDKFWGTNDGIGYNMLGKILMEIRAELRNQQ